MKLIKETFPTITIVKIKFKKFELWFEKEPIKYRSEFRWYHTVYPEGGGCYVVRCLFVTFILWY